mmetsp:Transcript_34244/g.79987  ORF Transcript_34244/g.79987 Transcript_34244/m.79987 type:complete len:366 (+) Transcript_34244:126-1223(+)
MRMRTIISHALLSAICSIVAVQIDRSLGRVEWGPVPPRTQLETAPLQHNNGDDHPKEPCPAPQPAGHSADVCKCEKSAECEECQECEKCEKTHVGQLQQQPAGDENLLDLWLNHTGRHLDKWMHYAHHYQEELPSPAMLRSQGRRIKMLEIGVQAGGSVQAWKDFYGDRLRYVGVDIDKRCKRSEELQNDISIEIGSQTDVAFLHAVCAKHGPFDVIIDDGGHSALMVATSVETLLWNSTCLKKAGGVYVVEDLRVLLNCYRRAKWYCRSPSDFSRIFGRVWEKMHNKYDPYPQVGRAGPIAVHMYQSMVFIHSGRQETLKNFYRGHDGFKNEEAILNEATGGYSREAYSNNSFFEQDLPEASAH